MCISFLYTCWGLQTMADKEHAFRNVAVPAEDHSLLFMIAKKEDRSMARQLAVMIREKYRELYPTTAPEAEAAGQGRGKKSSKS